jgi:ribosomal protein S18 acetylase RimI-like enzyme
MTDRAGAQIRVATPNDAQGLGSVHVASWRETYSGLLPDNTLSSLSVEARAAAWTKIMREPTTLASTVIYLAEHNGAIVGFGSCGTQRSEDLLDKGYDGEVTAIYVLRDFQKRKIGTRLFRELSSNLQQRGFKAAALWVLRENLRARHFYEHLGGKVIAEKEDVRDAAVLVELAYGWPNLKELDRSLAAD